jgi:hypothetical protein
MQHPENEPECVKAIEVEKYERCTFCSSKLVFSHDLNLNYFQVIETSRCPGCGVSMLPKKFTLH